MSEVRALIVDDSSVMRKIAERALQQAGLDPLVVLEAGSGTEGLDVLKTKQVDLILSDINMPSMDGLEFLRQIRTQKLAPGVPVVMITTESSEEHVKQAIQAGAQGYIRKPFTAEQVKERVLPLVGAAQAEGDGMLLNGIKRGATAARFGAGPQEMEQSMTLSLRDSVHLVSHPKHLDASVEEVFRLMLGVAVERIEGPLKAQPESLTAIVGLGGMLSGAFVFRCGARESMQVAAHMTGMEFAEIDDTVKDGIGEICNMLAGAWKSKVPELSANCGEGVLIFV